MKVFEPFKINQMELKNRMVVSAMVTNYCSEDGMATEKFIAYHEHKAKDGWGLIITEDYAVTPTAGGFKKLPRLWEDGQIESRKELTRRIHEAGGKIRNRARFAMEIIENIKEKCGKDYPVLYRMSAVEYVPGGLEIEESKILARLVEEAGADCIHCSQGVYASTHVIIPPSVVPRAAYVENAAEIKKVVDIPVIAVGRINDVEIAESVLQADKADLVTMARASLIKETN